MSGEEKRRVLVVDDFATMRRVVKNLLQELGYKAIREAAAGGQAKGMLEEGSFDLVVLDWNMPGTPGLDVLRWVRSHESLSSLPVLMVTAEATRVQIIEAAELGVNAYILKPFTAETLRKKLNFIFSRIAA